jgi:hypothetical protein
LNTKERRYAFYPTFDLELSPKLLLHDPASLSNSLQHRSQSARAADDENDEPDDYDVKGARGAH